ncbi:MAG: Zn-dependent hydrolase [Armatimonadetes bacterium]|nr:Zn-dependent hydrolase [Armatimonadota bacterium]
MSHPSIDLAPVDAGRLRVELQAFARIGYSADGSINRLAFTRPDLRARQVLMHRLRSLGLAPRVDAFGNVFGRLPGARDPELSPVLIGSHLDTVPGGGRFDGSAGVVAALEVAAVLRERGPVLGRAVEIVSFACEESSRFGRATLGSGLVAGTWDPGEVLTLRDARGVTLGQVLARLGLNPDRLADVRRNPGDYTAYLELHIEQGRVLEESGSRLGVVEAIAAPTRLRVDIAGRADHSGATPMPLRRDALAGAAEVILAVERIGRRASGVVATVGVIRAEPNAMNVVPGRVELGIDIRSTDPTRKAEVAAAVQQEIAAIAQARSLQSIPHVLSDEAPVTLDPRVVDVLERAAAARGVPAVRMASGAGHDAMQMARLCPAGMLLVPSRAGISHNREEWTPVPDIAAGTQVLLDAVLHVAEHGVR